MPASGGQKGTFIFSIDREEDLHAWGVSDGPPRGWFDGRRKSKTLSRGRGDKKVFYLV